MLAADGASVADAVVSERASAASAADLGDYYLHLRDHRAAEGCRADPPQPAVRGTNAIAAASDIFSPGGFDVAVLLLADVLARIIEVGVCIEDGIILGHSPDVTDLLLDSVLPLMFLLAVRDVFEKVYNGAEQRAESGESAPSSGGRHDGDRLQPGPGQPGPERPRPRAGGSPTGSSTTSSTPNRGPPSVARCSMRSAAAPPWAVRSGWAISSAAQESRSWRATGPPRPPRRQP